MVAAASTVIAATTVIVLMNVHVDISIDVNVGVAIDVRIAVDVSVPVLVDIPILVYVTVLILIDTGSGAAAGLATTASAASALREQGLPRYQEGDGEYGEDSSRWLHMSPLTFHSGWHRAFPRLGGCASHPPEG